MEKAELLPKPEGKPAVLILGGCGFIGRHLVKYLVDNKLVSTIRVSDKSLPATSSMSEEHKAAFAQKNIVEFKQADLSKDDHVAKAFKDQKFNYVVNLCGETRFGIPESDYKTKILDTATKCSAAAKAAEVEKWIEVSTAVVYDQPGTKVASTEESKLKPWTTVANYRLQAEEIVKKNGPPSVILRPSLVWGPGDLTSFTPRLTSAVVYKKDNEKMKFLWDKDLKVNCVHVRDAVAAIWYSCTSVKAGTLYNLSDETDLSQGALAEHVAAIFGIKVGFQNSLINAAAKMSLSKAASFSNDKHVPTWTKICQDGKVMNTPLSPYIDQELLSNNNLFVDGSKIVKESSGNFAYTTKMTTDGLKEVVTSFIKQGIFPNVF